MDKATESAVRALCDEIVSWQSPAGGIDHVRCRFHRDTPFGKASAFGQDLPWLARALYYAADALHEPCYKEAADRYAIYFIACMADHAPAFALGDAIDPCFVHYREHNLGDDALDGLYRNHSKINSIYKWLLEYRTDEGNYINAGYDWTDDDGVHHAGEDVGYSNDLSDVGRGLVAYARFFKSEEARLHAEGLARYFLDEFVPGTMQGVWSSELGTWVIGPRHTAGFENLEVHADEAGWGWSAYYAALFLLRLRDISPDAELRERVAHHAVASWRWTFAACQFDDGALGMQGRDDKWLGMTALGLLQTVELYRRALVDDVTHAEVYPAVLRALAWLRKYAAPESMPHDGYIAVTGASRPWPGWNTSWQFGIVVEGLLVGAEIESFAASRKGSE